MITLTARQWHDLGSMFDHQELVTVEEASGKVIARSDGKTVRWNEAMKRWQYAAANEEVPMKITDFIESNPRKLGGQPVFKGTRFSVTQFLAELADGRTIADVAEDFELDGSKLSGFMHTLAVSWRKLTSFKAEESIADFNGPLEAGTPKFTPEQAEELRRRTEQGVERSGKFHEVAERVMERNQELLERLSDIEVDFAGPLVVDNPSSWPDGFFEQIHINDPAFVRPPQEDFTSHPQQTSSSTPLM